MSLGIQGKVALVTAGSRGLGYACARALADEGAKVAICARHKKQLAIAVKELGSRHPTSVIGIQADLTQEKDLHRLVRETARRLGQIDILVMSTGHLPSGSFGRVSDDDWELGRKLTIAPATLLSRLLVPSMRKQRFGRLIFLSSVFGLEPDSGYVISSTFRAGLSAFAKCLSSEVAVDGVTVNVVAPGYFDTPLLDELAQKRAAVSGKSAQRILSDWGNLSPTRRLGAPEELGAAVALLASPKSAFIQGVTLAVDGGFIKGI